MKHDNTDLGFKLFDTYGVGYQLTGDEAYKKVVLAAADTLARATTRTSGCSACGTTATTPLSTGSTSTR